MEIGFQVQYDSPPKWVQTEESIKEAKACCAPSIREAETTCAHSIKEAEAHCSTANREAEAQGASQASSIQQSHAKGIQHLEEEAIEEESKGQLNFLSTAKLPWKPVLSNAVACYLLPIKYYWDTHWHPIFSASPKEHPPPNQGPSLGLLPPLPILHLGLHPGPGDGITYQIWWISHLLARPCPRQLPRGPQFKAAGDNASSQSVDKKPSRGIWPRHEGGILQEPLPKL